MLGTALESQYDFCIYLTPDYCSEDAFHPTSFHFDFICVNIPLTHLVYYKVVQYLSFQYASSYVRCILDLIQNGTKVSFESISADNSYSISCRLSPALR